MTDTTRISRSAEEILLQATDLGMVLGDGSVLTNCNRCGGSGHYSFNLMHGTVCFGCSGSGKGERIDAMVYVRRQQAADRREFHAQEKIRKAAEARDARRASVPPVLNVAAQALGHAGAIEMLDSIDEYAEIDGRQMSRMEIFVRDMVYRHLNGKDFSEKQLAYVNRIPEIVAEREEKTERQRDAGWLGQVGEKFEGVRAKLFFARVLETQWGKTTLVKFETAEGKILVWFATGYRSDFVEHLPESYDDYRVIEGDFILRGTVKAHDTYQGSPQTTITRCKAEEVA